MKLNIALLITTIFLFFGLINRTQANSVLHFDSDMNIWVGQGESYTFTPYDGFEFNVWICDDNGITLFVDSFDSNPENPLW